MEIDAVNLVIGDVVDVKVGNNVPADCRICQINSTVIRVDQSILTGESQAVSKESEKCTGAVIQDKRNMIFSGTCLQRGDCLAVVVATGRSTEMGKISRSITEADQQKTPLQKKLDEFGELLSKVICVICILVWLININHFNDPKHGGSMWKGAVYYFKIAVALAVAAIPEGLPAVVTTCLSLGVMKMAKKNAIVRSLPSVETLGCTSVICSDKTGTLTTNQMVARHVLIFDKANSTAEYTLEGSTYEPSGIVKNSSGIAINHPAVTSKSLYMISKIATMCNDASIGRGAGGDFMKSGEATEASLKVLAEKLGLPEANDEKNRLNKPVQSRFRDVSDHYSSINPKEATLDFSRDRKSMSVLVKEGKDTMLLCKGAPEMVMGRCSKILVEGEGEKDFSKDLRSIVETKIRAYGEEHAFRCLALAYKKSPAKQDLSNPENFIKVEQEMVLVGIVAIKDPPREEVAHAIEVCHNAGIKVVVITGDNKGTAEAICRQIGIFQTGESTNGCSFTGQEWDKLGTPAADVGEKELSRFSLAQKDAVMNARLFSRVEPAHKKAFCAIMQERGEIVAMTGDGVNDAPALKKADIGIGMGSGTAVAKSASNMVLADDNFKTIVVAVEEGRAIYNNTKSFIRYLISSNIGEVVCIFLTAALGLPEALVPVQLLWVNLVTDGLPATALGFNPADSDIMSFRPRRASEPIVDGWLFFRYMAIGIYVGFATVFGMIWWYMFYTGVDSNGNIAPHLSWEQLSNHSHCSPTHHLFVGVNCDIFKSYNPSSMSLSILVTVEMFNALNSLSENQSILVMHPFNNPLLIGAIALSFALHFGILYVPAVAKMFLVAPLSLQEWVAVLWMSFPVIILDEVMKGVSRILHNADKLKRE